MTSLPEFLQIDPPQEIDRIVHWIQLVLRRRLNRTGLVVGVSGGVDSAVVLGLCARAVGPERTVALLMPERESSPRSLELGRLVASQFGVEATVVDITKSLEDFGCYREREAIVGSLVPEFGPGWEYKIVMSQDEEHTRVCFFSLVAQSPNGDVRRIRLPAESYLGIVSATNFKQRTRKTIEYYHADRRNYAVAGTPNRLEMHQGFFVRQGDGAADLKPIAHLYKSQVYQLAQHLGVPDEIISEPPSTDTYSLFQTQEEFFFALPYDQLDVCLYGREKGLSALKVAQLIGRAEEEIVGIYRDLDRKRKSTTRMHLPALTLESD